MNRPGEEARREALSALGQRLSPSQVVVEKSLLQTYARDESDSGEFPPDILVFAEKTADVVAVFETCQRLSVPVTPCAARTGKSGGSLPLYGGVALSLERMNRIKAVSVEDLIAIAEPGVITGDLMKAVEARGLFYPPDPNSLESCSLGGNVAENAGGPRALKYGVTKDYVIGLEWVLPDGTVLRVGRQTIKGVAGYDLVGLFVGSEGTLGVATEITVQLIPLPKRVKTALILFRSVLDAARAVSATLASGLLPRALELLDELCIRAVAGKGLHLPAEVNAAVLAEVDGNADQALLEELASLEAICRAHGSMESMVAEEESERQRLWTVRRIVSTALRSIKPFKISEDVAVPRSRIADAIQQFRLIADEMGLTAATYGHAGDGNLHANVLFSTLAERSTAQQAVERMLRCVVQMGGTITGEHGIGFAKRDYLALEQSQTVIRLQRQLKRFFDPSGLLNPGKIFAASSD